jgi:hypothetical protein
MSVSDTSDEGYDPDADPEMLTSTTQQPDQAEGEGEDDSHVTDSPQAVPENER